MIRTAGVIFGLLAIWIARVPMAAETLEPCGPVDEYFQILDARIDAGMLGRPIAAMTALPFQEPEWGVRVLERQGTYSVRVTTLERVLLYTDAQSRARIPVRVEEFSLSAELAQRIEAALNREMAKTHNSSQVALPDNPIFRLSTDGANCGRVMSQSMESIPYKIVRVFLEIKCIPDLPRSKVADPFAKVEALLSEIEAAK